MDSTERAARAALEIRIWQLRSRAWTVERIAAEVKLQPREVVDILTRIARRNTALMDKAPRQILAEQIGQLERIADEALQAWVRSKGGGGEDDQTGAGDPRFLAAAQAAMKDIRSGLGLGVNRIELSGSPDAPLEVVTQPYTLDQLSEVLRILSDLGALPQLLGPRDSEEG